MLTEQQRAFERVCFRAAPPREALAELGASPERWLLYRDMVRSRLRKMVRSGLRRTAQALGPEVYEAAFAAWLDEAPPRTRYIREVVSSFLDHAMPRWSRDGSVAPQVLDLARYERAKWEAGYDPAEAGETSELTFERVAVLNPTARILRLAHAVHEPEVAAGAYREAQVQLCVFRHPQRPVVKTWWLEPRTADTLEALKGSDGSLVETLRGLAEDRGDPIDAAFVESVGSMVADLLSAGILIGGREVQR